MSSGQEAGVGQVLTFPDHRRDRPNPDLFLSLPPAVVNAIAEQAAALVLERVGAGVERWVGVDEAAEHLACGKSRIYALVSARRIPHERDGSRLLFRRSDLDRWLAAGGALRP